MTDAPSSGELGKNLAIWTVVGAVVGATVGGLGFFDSGFNLLTGGIGLVTGALVLATLTWLVSATAARAPEWLLQLLAGWLFAGVIWEQKFERKSEAQLAGLAIGVLLVLAIVARGWLAKPHDPGRANPLSPPTDGNERKAPRAD